MKFKNTVNHKLLIIMSGFGIFTGIAFPVFVMFVLDLPAAQVLTLPFFSMCIIAGLLVGGFNYLVFKRVIYDFLEIISTKLTAFREKLSHVRREEAIECDAEECLITTKSDDPLVGNITNSFNEFITTIQNSMRAELITNRFLEDLKQGLSVKGIADVVLDAFVQYFGGTGGCILSYDRGEFTVLKAFHSLIELDRLDHEELYQIMSSGECVVHEHLLEKSLKLNIAVGDFVPDHVAFIPLKYQSANIGIAVLMAENEFIRPFNSLESKNFIKQSAPFLYNSSLIRRLEELAAIDELTGVLNRRFGMKRLEEEFSRAQRYNSSFSIGLIDLDHFKNVNDTYGHQTGDQVLRDMATHLQKDLRTSDFVVRYGGEEFLVALPGASLVDGLAIINRIRKQVETSKFQYGSYTISYTFSGGVCSYPSEDIQNPSDLIKIADEMLYKAKRSGRNRIVTPGHHG